MKNSYLEELDSYRLFVKATGAVDDELRVEAQFECLKDRSLIGDLDLLKQWFLEQQELCQMTLEDIPLNACRGWSFDEETGWIHHKSGEFFLFKVVELGLLKIGRLLGVGTNL